MGRDDETKAAPAPEPPGATRHPFLLVLSGPQVGELHRLAPGRPVVIGRHAGADIRIEDEGVSRRHCRITSRGESALLRDLGSANGTYVGGVRIEERALARDERFQIGACTTLKFTVADELEAAAQRRLAEAALRDPLTGLFNRRHLEQRLAAEVAAAHRHRRPLSLLVVDVDHFKQVNDRHGHLAGDEVLKSVARALEKGVRIEDVLARYGGEEFVVLARDAALPEAALLAERLRQLVERSRCAASDMTVSVGVAELLPNQDARGLFAAADAALYKAKQEGRNRVSAAKD